MKNIFFSLLILCFAPLAPSLNAQVDVFVGGKLQRPFDMGVNSGQGNTGYAKVAGDSMTIGFLEEQLWSAVFITVGRPTSWGTKRQIAEHEKNLSGYTRVTLQMRGAAGGETVQLGIKDSNDPDDGSECKENFTLTKEWKTWTLNIPKLKSSCDPGSDLDLTKVYVALEFVYIQDPAQTIYVKNIKYQP